MGCVSSQDLIQKLEAEREAFKLTLNKVKI